MKKALLQLLYPDDVCCALCNEEAFTRGGICEACREKLIPCAYKEHSGYLRDFYAPWAYEEPLKTAIHRFKYDNQAYLASFLASRMTPKREWPPLELIPVPLYPKKEQKRGYNQSLLLAQKIAERHDLQLTANLLLRIKDTPSQTEQSAAGRRENLKDAFALAKGKDCRGRQLLLIDDVYTTGSTIGACAETLLRGGAAGVYAMTIAATMQGD